MSIIKYSIENELIGTRTLNQNLTKTSKSRKSFTGLSRNLPELKMFANTDNFTRRLPPILREHEFDLTRSHINKIFTAQWLDDRKVLMGTKCNKIVTLDTQTGKYSIQNPLKSHRKSIDVQNHCGIHSISINPSRTLLATGAEHVNDIAVYSLPTMEPVSVGYGAHNYWIFDFIWLDDQHVCSGAGDNRLALWRVDTDLVDKQSQFKLLNSETEDSFASSPSKSTMSRNKTNRSASLKRLLPSSSSSSSSPSSSFFTLPNLASQHRPSQHSSLFNAYNSNTNFTSTFYNNTNNTNSTSSLFRHTRRSPNSFNPFFAFRSTHASRLEEIASQTYFLSSYFNRQINENDELSSNLAQNNDTFDLDLDDDDDGDDDDEGDSENYLIATSDSSSSSNDLDWDLHNPLANDLNEEDENNPLFTNSDTDDYDTSYNDNNNNNMSIVLDDTDNSDDDDDDNEIGLKRRRLNSIGKYITSNGFKYSKPIKVIKCKQSKRIRALAFNLKRNEIAAISMNSAFHYFDIKRFEQKYTKKLSPLKENVCLSINSDYSIYAIGSASHVQLLDANNARQLVQPVFIKRDIGIRSVHFRNDILSIGTGIGTVLFYDLRAHKFLSDGLDSDPTNQLKLKTNGGWILRNDSYYENLTYPHNTDNTHAIYAHSYDPSGTKLLTAGGPLTVNFHGHYAGVWR